MYSFIETKLFTKLIEEYLDDESYAELQSRLIENPESGAIVRGSGGVRKLRWALPGGGVRIIYYARVEQGEIWMLTIYKKSDESAIPAHLLKQIKEEIDG